MVEIRKVDVGYDGQLLLQTAERVIGRDRVNRRWIQRHLRFGWVKADTLMILLEDVGIVGPERGGYREVLVPLAEKGRVLRELAAMVEVQKLRASDGEAGP